jgi:hypothetical protein
MQPIRESRPEIPTLSPALSPPRGEGEAAGKTKSPHGKNRAGFFNPSSLTGSIARQRQRDAGLIGAITAAGELEADLVRAIAGASQRDAICATADTGDRGIRLGRLHCDNRNQREEGNCSNNYFVHSADIFHPFKTEVNERPAGQVARL